MKKILALILAAVLVAGAFVGCDSTQPKTTDEKTFIMGLDENFPPMGYKDENGKIVGFDVDVATEVCSRLGYTLKLQPINWASKEMEINTGNIDCIWNGFSVTPSRAEELNMTVTYMKNHQVILVPADSEYQTLADLAGTKLGVQRDSSAEVALEENADIKDSFAEIVALDDYAACVNEARIGTIHAIAIDEIVANHYTKDGEFRVLMNGDEVESLAEEDFAVGFRKNDTELAEAIRSTLKEMKEDGSLAKISEEWFGKDITVIG